MHSEQGWYLNAPKDVCSPNKSRILLCEEVCFCMAKLATMQFTTCRNSKGRTFNSGTQSWTTLLFIWKCISTIVKGCVLTNSTSKDNILHPPLNRRLHLKAFLFNPWTTHTQSVPSLISTQFKCDVLEVEAAFFLLIDPLVLHCWNMKSGKFLQQITSNIQNTSFEP